jgi:hypothetical protein
MKAWKVEQLPNASVLEERLNEISANGGTVFAVDLSGWTTVVWFSEADVSAHAQSKSHKKK